MTSLFRRKLMNCQINPALEMQTRIRLQLHLKQQNRVNAKHQPSKDSRLNLVHLYPEELWLKMTPVNSIYFTVKVYFQ